MSLIIYPTSRVVGSIKVPGDKSISHRALLFGALATGETRVSNLLKSQDVLATWKCLEKLGTEIIENHQEILIRGRGLSGFHPPRSSLDCQNSGTSLRLLCGILSGASFETNLVGDSSLSKRPMKRVAQPLRQMGAQIELFQNETLPLRIFGGKMLQGIEYSLPIASAQLKGALLLAGLSAEGHTVLSGKIQSRDHTERLLPHFGVEILQNTESLSIQGQQKLRANSISVPGDFSSAAFWITAAAIVPGASIDIEGVSLNSTRTGLVKILKRMNGTIKCEVNTELPEPIGQIQVSHSPLQAVSITGDEVPEIIDELPLIAILATFAEGRTDVRGASELRVKESDRIESIASNLRSMGGQIETFEDGFSIEGPQLLKGGKINPHGDHRIAMAFSIAALQAQGPTEIRDADCVNVSYPGFFTTLQKLAYTGVTS